MANGSGSQKTIRQAIGALKDTTKVGLVKVNSEYKGIDIAIVKATSHDVVLPKEKHIKTIFCALSPTSPRADVAHCIHRLIKRLSKTHTWTVALKTLLIIHRSIRENDPSFPEELINYSRGRNLMLNLSHFRDSSTIEARDYSTWIRTYALYLEERLECYRVMKYDINRDPSGTKMLDNNGLFEQLPAMQLLLFRLLACKPEGAAVRNSLIHYCLSVVGCEASSLYIGISNGIMNLVDKFFEMRPGDATRALEIYKRASTQASKLSDFFEICRAYDVNHELRFAKIEQAPASFVTAMEDYVKQNSPTSSSQTRLRNYDDEAISRKPVDFTTKVVSPIIPVDLFDSEPEVMDVTVNPSQGKSNIEVKINSTKDEVINFETSFIEIPAGNIDTGNIHSNSFATSQATSWELALVTAFSYDDEVNPNPTTLNNTLAGGFYKTELDKVTLEGLYGEVTTADRPNQIFGDDMNPEEEVNPFGASMSQDYNHQDPCLASNTTAMSQQDLSFNMFRSEEVIYKGESNGTSSRECVENPFIDSSHYMLPSYHHLPHPHTSFSVLM